MNSNLPIKAAARRLIQALVDRGVTTFFGIPGGPICPVFEAIRLHPQARLIESRHETHAVFAASLYYRASGNIPAVVVTAGPGATNAVTGVASASLERIPMIVIAGDVTWAATGKRTAQDSGPEGIHLESIYRSITRGQLRSAKASSLASQAMAALQLATNPSNPGPVLLVAPLDQTMAPCDDFYTFQGFSRDPKLLPSHLSVENTAKLLSEASRPLIVIGAGCRGYEQEIRALVDSTNIPFVTTPRAKGLVSERHPRSLRNGGMAASMWARRYTAEPVDLCLVLGTDLDDTSMGPTRYVGPGGKVIHVDLDPNVFGRNVPTEMAITSDVGIFSQYLADYTMVNSNVNGVLREVRESSPFDVPAPQEDNGDPIKPHRFLMELQKIAPEGTRFVTDIGEHMLFALHYLTAEPGTFFIQLNLGSMASGIAGAIGLSVANPSAPVVCIAGDGGMQMAGMEALVAKKERLPILFAVFNDGRYNMVHHGMRQIFGEADTYEMPPVDFVDWARAIGIPSMKIESPGEVPHDLVTGLEGPMVLDVRIDPSVRIRGGGRVEALQHMSMLQGVSK